ncbi:MULTISPECIES: DUF1707 SHOCT-like domain-containing protein [Actinomadura]|uniref:DUF1707 domain-containing protein n=1 Tax=Actinomadura yumaensis TaxID=111807 RepID=A0ABW2CSM2_9ACTN|nr:DUF1707 domain-containing protein [Actinomadura sp. J1-007]MWK39781.1 DUF1707 domain-containing protein [Actinomadura sp. J1-007]
MEPHRHTEAAAHGALDVPGAPGAPGVPGVRAADADRDTAIERLGDALAEGALDTAEYNRRLERAAQAATLAELRALTADLPVSRAAQAKAEVARRTAQQQADKRAWLNEWGYWAGGALIMNAIWGYTCLKDGDLKFYWPALPLAIWAIVLISYALWPDRKNP